MEFKQPATVFFKTQRLIARSWQQSDLAPFAAINASTQVMQYFPKTLNKAESDAYAGEMQRRIDANGFGFWAIEEKASGRFIGFVGLNAPKLDLPFAPCVEIGWRLATEYWGKGYATEAAEACLDFAFKNLQLSDIYAFTAVPNFRSERVMQRLGMHNTYNNFMHPALPHSHPLCEHVLYKIDKGQWQSG